MPHPQPAAVAGVLPAGGACHAARCTLFNGEIHWRILPCWLSDLHSMLNVDEDDRRKRSWYTVESSGSKVFTLESCSIFWHFVRGLFCVLLVEALIFCFSWWNIDHVSKIRSELCSHSCYFKRWNSRRQNSWTHHRSSMMALMNVHFRASHWLLLAQQLVIRIKLILVLKLGCWDIFK